MNFKFPYLFLIRSHFNYTNLHGFKLISTAWVLILRTDSFKWHSSHTLLTCASICKSQPWSHYTIYSYVPHLWTNSTSEVSNTLFYHVPSYSLNFSKNTFTYGHPQTGVYARKKQGGATKNHSNLETSKEREHCTTGHSYPQDKY